MKKKLLGCTISLLLISTQAYAQQSQDNHRAGSYDDRWYVTLGAGANNQDSARDTENATFGTLGVGKFINPRWSLDAEINYQNPKANRNEDLNFSQYGISLDARRHFRREGRLFNPYLVGGVGYQRAQEEFDNSPFPESPGQSSRGYATAKLGAGVQADFRKVSMRAELAARHSFDSDSVIAPNESGFTDTLASLTLLVPLGPTKPIAAAVPAPVVPLADHCSLDDDGDGVLNCQDECDSPQDGVVDATGCSTPLIIDLGSVGFDFDSDTLTPQAKSVLNESVSILQHYPSLKVEITGHTDLCGSEEYNDNLSFRRAHVVYEYLKQQGVEENRLGEPMGFGEQYPRVETPQSYPECKNETNRRTELNVQE